MSLHTTVEVDADVSVSDNEVIAYLVENRQQLMPRVRAAIEAEESKAYRTAPHWREPPLSPPDIAELFRALDSIDKVEALRRIRCEAEIANITWA
jgi:hypothetical protein